MAYKIIGRNRELGELKDIYNSKRSEFVAIYGRRRVGKTYLIHNYFINNKCTYFHAVGLQKGNMSKQLQNFTDAIAETFYNNEPLTPAVSWMEAFSRLTKAIENSSHSKTNKIILFFDELPWMATPRSGLLEALDYYWNKYWSNMPNMKLIICGSSASWIIRKIIYDKGGLHNRVTKQIILGPFTLFEAKEYLEYLGCKYNAHQILELYMVIGGIPFYLNDIKKNLSAMQNIDNLCFNKAGILFDEFDKLFASLFKDSAAYIEIIRVIAQTRYGISRSELEAKCKLSEQGGSFSNKLKAIEDAGFIISFLPFEHNKKGLFYKVIDEYSLFYLQWIEPEKSSLLKIEKTSGFWKSNYKTPAWHSWAGYSFEAVCYKHLHIIRKVLNIPEGSTASTWEHRAEGGGDNGAQIDLLFDRKDKACSICEIKYTEEPYVITKEYARKLQNKEQVFMKQTGTTKQIFLAMIAANGVKDNIYFEDLIKGLVTTADFFKNN